MSLSLTKIAGIEWISRWLRLLLIFAALVLPGLSLSGCVTKAQARAQAQAAFLAGQQQALTLIKQNPQIAGQGPTVTLHGQVRNSVVSWTPDLTLAKALLAAEYFGPDPSQIFIARRGRAITVDSKQLLNGYDEPLQAGDVVQIGKPAENPMPQP